MIGACGGRSTSSAALVPVAVLGALLALSSCLAASTKASSDARGAAKSYALLFGTVYGPGNHSVYGVKVKIRRSDQKKAKWELYSDHSGEFAVRLPAGAADYTVWAEVKGGKDAQISVHFDNDERKDISLHLPQ